MTSCSGPKNATSPRVGWGASRVGTSPPYTGELPAAAVVVNVPVRRNRITGTDLLPGFAEYLHPLRWTSLGPALLEAVHLGMPVVALATTEAHEAVPPGTGYCSTDPDRLVRGLRDLVADPRHAREVGAAARAHVLRRYGLDRFLGSWEDVLHRTIHRRPRAAAVSLGRS